MDLVVAFEGMDDETAIRHFEARHVSQLNGLKFHAEPQQEGRRFRAGRTPWEIHHRRLHRLAKEAGDSLDHEHEVQL